MQTSASHKIAARYVAPGEVISRWRPFIFVEASEGRRLIVYWRRLGLYLAALCLVGWLAAAGVAWTLLRSRHHFPDLSYLNLVLPFRWDEHRHALGRHYIALGRQALAEDRLADAVFNLRNGLRRAPTETSARLDLAELCLRHHQTAPALELLLPRIDQEWQDPRYLELTLDLLTQSGRDATIIDLAQKHLPRAAVLSVERNLLALRAAQAHFRQGDLPAAEQLLRTWHLEETAPGAMLLASIDEERDYPQLAVVRLEQAIALHPDAPEPPLMLLRLLLGLNQTEAADRIALQRYASDPFSPGPRIDLLLIWVRSRDTALIDRELERYVRDFGSDQQALSLLAGAAVTTACPPIARQAREAAARAGFPLHPFHVMETETLLRAQVYAEAGPALARALADTGPQINTLLQGFRAVLAQHANDTSAIGYLSLFLSQQPRASDSLTIAQLFAQMDETFLAHRVTAEAARQTPTNADLLALLVELDLKTDKQADLETDVRRLLALPKPPRASLKLLATKLADLAPAHDDLLAEVRTALNRPAAHRLPGQVIAQGPAPR